MKKNIYKKLIIFTEDGFRFVNISKTSRLVSFKFQLISCLKVKHPIEQISNNLKIIIVTFVKL